MSAGVLDPVRRHGPLLRLLVQREFRTRTAGSLFGVAWNVVHPLVMIAIYLLVFGSIMAARGGGSGLQYAVHLTAGIIPWFYFAEIVSRSTTVLVENGNFLRKLAFPAEVLHLAIVVQATIVHGVSLLALWMLLTALGASPGAGLLWALPVFAALGVLGLGLGLMLSVVHLVVRDTSQVVSILLQFFFWLTPIVYYIAILPDWAAELVRYNPLMPFIATIQWQFGAPEGVLAPESLHVLWVLPLMALLAGTTFLRRHRRELLDEL